MDEVSEAIRTFAYSFVRRCRDRHMSIIADDGAQRE
jgi:hypothetical protein